MRYDLIIAVLIPALWLAWIAYWWYSARDVKKTSRPEPLRSKLKHRIPLVLGALFLAAPRLVPRVLTRRFVPESLVYPAAGTLLLALGLGFAVWARRHLGRNWSAQVVVKEDHALVRSGPYRYVRHPIYTGILLAFLGMALTIGEWRALVGLAFVLLSFMVKSREEEGRMRETFPEYQEYQRRTAALVPYVY
jgi:protein-S-isoprenylcysteine O-methyltransferase Ste14